MLHADVPPHFFVMLPTCILYMGLHGKFVKNKDTREERQHFSHLELCKASRLKVEKVRDKKQMEGFGKSSSENKCTEGIFLYRNFHNLLRPSDQHVIN